MLRSKCLCPSVRIQRVLTKILVRTPIKSLCAVVITSGASVCPSDSMSAEGQQTAMTTLLSCG